MIVGLLDDHAVALNLFNLTFAQQKEAVRTSIFSSRWRKLWKTSLKILDFDTKNYTHIDIEDLDLDDDAFVRWVDQILALYKGTKLEAFRLIRPSLHVDYSHEIDKWICFALSKKVEKLNISVCSSTLIILREKIPTHFLINYLTRKYQTI